MTNSATRDNPPAPNDIRILVHDVRNALTPVFTGIEILRGRGLPDDQRALLDMMASQVGLLTDILNGHERESGDGFPEMTDARAASATSEPSQPDIASRSVLVVDDNPNILASLKMLFEDRAYTVFAAINAEDAVDLAARFKPGFCLCDISLPTIDGFAAASKLLLANPAMRLFSMSGLDDLSDREQSQKAGFLAHFKKPILFDEMIHIMERRPRNHRASIFA
jgi:CheY-like chemotaxis protein